MDHFHALIYTLKKKVRLCVPLFGSLYRRSRSKYNTVFLGIHCRTSSVATTELLGSEYRTTRSRVPCFRFSVPCSRFWLPRYLGNRNREYDVQNREWGGGKSVAPLAICFLHSAPPHEDALPLFFFANNFPLLHFQFYIATVQAKGGRRRDHPNALCSRGTPGCGGEAKLSLSTQYLT